MRGLSETLWNYSDLIRVLWRRDRDAGVLRVPRSTEKMVVTRVAVADVRLARSLNDVADDPGTQGSGTRGMVDRFQPRMPRRRRGRHLEIRLAKLL